MNKNISEEKIEIDGIEYTLFLNRVGIVNWERMTKITSKQEHYQSLLSNLNESDEVEITDDTDPFTMYNQEETTEAEKELEEILEMYVKFYWVALYTHHKLSITEVRELFNKACEEYGFNQLAELANQMLTNANKDLLQKERKNLKALKSTKEN